MQAGSLSSAAELLNISQPAASKMLAQAEQSLGIALFKRLPGGLKPTPEAELLFQETKQLHSSLERVRQLSRNLAAHPGGLLRIGCIPSLGLSLIPQVVASFVKQCPDVSINIRTENNEVLSALLLAREIDIGIAFEPKAPAGIFVKELGRARAVYFGPDIPPIGRSKVHLNELDLARWIRLDTADPLGSRVEDALNADGDIERNASVEVKTYYLARALVESDVGFAIIDEYTAQSSGAKSQLTLIEPPLSVGVCIMTPASDAGTQALKVLVNLLSRRLSIASQE